MVPMDLEKKGLADTCQGPSHTPMAREGGRKGKAMVHKASSHSSLGGVTLVSVAGLPKVQIIVVIYTLYN